MDRTLRDNETSSSSILQANRRLLGKRDSLVNTRDVSISSSYSIEMHVRHFYFSLYEEKKLLWAGGGGEFILILFKNMKLFRRLACLKTHDTNHFPSI